VKGQPKSKWVDCAVKRMPLHLVHVAEREALMMDLIAHPNCTRLIATYNTTHYIHLVIEYAANGDLHSWLAHNGAMDVDSARFIGSEIGDALRALHSAAVVFGDLKPEVRFLFMLSCCDFSFPLFLLYVSCMTLVFCLVCCLRFVADLSVAFFTLFVPTECANSCEWSCQVG
jgi:hypothetical protein